jgi:raffinose/stachyose/melibiose transport system permease protein
MSRSVVILGHIGKWLLNIFVWIVSLSCVFPIIWIIYSSLKTSQEFSMSIISLPKSLVFQNYIDALENSGLGKMFVNSMFTSIVSVIFIIIFGFFAGYFLSRFSFIGRGLIYTLFLFGMLIPIHSLLIPLFVQFSQLDLTNNRFTLILPYVAFNLPLVIFLVENYVKSIPFELEEASYIDGSSVNNTLFRIILPMCMPVLSTALVLSFLHAWNEFPFALVLISDEALKTVPVGLSNFKTLYSINYPQFMAALVISVVPVILVYMIAHRKIIQGMAAGALKG